MSIIVAAFVSMIIGFIWYSPKLGFGKAWMQWSGIPSDTPPQDKSTAIKSMLLGFLSQLVMATAIAILIISLEATTPALIARLTLTVWFGFVATIQLGSVLWENRPWKLWVLNSTYWLISIFVMGAIIISF